MNGTFDASQVLSNGTLSASASSTSGYRLALDDVVVSSGMKRGTILATATVQCPATSSSLVTLNLSLSSPNPYSLPIRTGNSPSQVWLTKANAPAHRLGPLLVTCASNQIVYNSLRTFAVSQNALYATNGTEDSALCFSVPENGTVVSTRCSTSPSETWSLRPNGRIVLNGTRSCLAGTFTNKTVCPSASLDPASKPECRSQQWEIGVIDDCATADNANALTKWAFDRETKFLSLLGSETYTYDGEPRCLTLIPPLISNGVAVSARIDSSSKTFSSENTADMLFKVECGTSIQIAVGVASERDSGAGMQLQLAQKFSNASQDDAVSIKTRTRDWWTKFWDRSFVRIGTGEYAAVQKWYETMMYLLRASNEEGAVAPALWGPFSVSDAPDWGDEMTLDYNFEANFWAAATSNHPELIHSYAATVTSLLSLSRQRASLKDWSRGGWVDMFGAEVMGMSCGYTVDWDHDCKGFVFFP